MADTQVAVKVTADTSQFVRGTAQATSSVERLGKQTDAVSHKARLAKAEWAAFGAGVTLAGAKAVMALNECTKASSDLAESTSKVGVIFGSSSGEIERFATGAAKAIGMSKLAAQDATSMVAGFGKAAGLSGQELAKFSEDLVTRAADIRSLYGASSTDQVVQDMGSALMGEYEPMRKYLVMLDEATVKNRAMAMGLIDNTKNALTPQTRALVVANEIMAQSTIAADDFTRTADGLANSQQSDTAAFENSKAALGEALLPIMTDATKTATDLAEAFSNLPKPLQETFAIVVGLTAVVALVGPGFAATVSGIRSGVAALREYTAAALEAKAASAGVGVGGVPGAVAGAAGKGAIIGTVAAGAAALMPLGMGGQTTMDAQLLSMPATEAAAAYDQFRDSVMQSGASLEYVNSLVPEYTASVNGTTNANQGAAQSEADKQAITSQTAAANQAAAASEAAKAAAVDAAAESMRKATAAAFDYFNAQIALAQSNLSVAGWQSDLQSVVEGNAAALAPKGGSGGGSSSSSRKRTPAEIKADKEARAQEAKERAAHSKAERDDVNKEIAAIRKKDQAAEDAEVKRLRRRAQAHADAVADAGARRDVQQGVAGAIATDKAAKAGKDIDGKNQTGSTGEATGSISKADQKRLDADIEAVRKAHQKSVDAQVKALNDNLKAHQKAERAAEANAKATKAHTAAVGASKPIITAASLSLDANTEAGRRNQEWLAGKAQEIVNRGKAVYDAAILAGKGEKEAAKMAADSMEGDRKTLLDVTDAVGLAHDEVTKYLKKLGLTPKTIKTKFQVDTSSIDKAIAKADKLLAKQRAIDKLTANSRMMDDRAAGAAPAKIPKLPLPKPPDWAKADGGLLSGPGTRTSDSMLLAASTDEYVIRAEAVDFYGVGLFDALNGKKLPRFAKGGLAGRQFFGRADMGSRSAGALASQSGLQAPLVGSIQVVAPSPTAAGQNVIDRLAEAAYRAGGVR